METVKNLEAEAHENHAHSEEGGESLKGSIIKLCVAGVFFAASFFVDSYLNFAFLFIAYLAVGAEVIINAIKELVTEFSVDEEFLMTIATVGAWAIGEWTEAAAVMLFYAVGELLEDAACERSRKSVTALLKLRPDEITVKRGGKPVSIPLEEAEEGDIAMISPGERIAVDGIIISGETLVDNSALTGESLPINCAAGDSVYGGGLNKTGAIEIKITKPYAQSSSARILELVENAQEKKAKAERFITRFARKYTLIVVLLAIFIAFICPLFTGYSETFSGWFYRGLTLLVVSCPCAFVISVPLSFFAGIGCASRNGVLVKGAASLETLSKLKAAAFDKTGTVTKGELSVTTCRGADETLKLAAYAESRSTHPIAKAIVKAYGREIDYGAIESVSEEAGKGVCAVISGDRVSVGRGEDGGDSLAVTVMKNGEKIGEIELSDEIKPDSRTAVEKLRAAGVNDIIMLSGDRKAAAEKAAHEVGIGDVRAELTPEGKCAELGKIREKCGVTAFAGDGINDAPVLAMSDIGVAMGGLGSDAAIETADVVILDDKLTKLADAVKIGRKTMRTAYECAGIALIAKVVVIALEIAGLAGMWAAVFADVGVTVICILNSLRAFYYKIK